MVDEDNCDMKSKPEVNQQYNKLPREQDED